MSLFPNSNDPNGQQQRSIPTGPALLLKSLGFDPQEIMANVEAAKNTAQQVMQHFDARLQTVEQRLSLIENCQAELLVLLRDIRSELKDLTQRNSIQPEVR